MTRTLSHETQTIVQYLRDCAIASGIATYDEMSKRLHIDIRRGRGRNHVQAALNIVKREFSFTFVNIPKVGYRPLSEEEIAKEKGKKFKGTVRSATKTYRSDLDCIQDVSALPSEAKKDYWVGQTMLLFVEEQVKPSTERNFRKHLSKSQFPENGVDTNAKNAWLALIDVS